MLRVMLQKLLHKKWMNLCLLLGCTMLIATVISFPLYEKAAFNRMFQDEFDNYLFSEGNWPGMTTFLEVSRRESGSGITKMEQLMQELNEMLGTKEKETIYFYYLDDSDAVTDMKRDDIDYARVSMGFLSDLATHITMLSGEMYSETGLTEDGAIEAIVSEECIVNRKLLVGDTLTFDKITDAQGNPIRVYIKGVYERKDANDYYWQVGKEALSRHCLMNEHLFKQMFPLDKAEQYSYNCYYYSLFEYQDIPEQQSKELLETTNYIFNKSEYKNFAKAAPYREILEGFIEKRARIQATLLILKIPNMIMLIAFLFMISGQMYEMERNEISVIKSRGSSGGQILRLYFYQSLFLTIMGGLLGVPLGMLFSRLLGSTRTFLEFGQIRNLNIVYDQEALLYTLGAMLAVLLILTLPAIKHSRVSIVHLKQQKAIKKKNFWEKLYLDIIMLGISFYGYYSFTQESKNMAANVIEEKSLDPLLYISSSLFIFGLGLLFLRLQPLIVKLIYSIGKKWWKPASYASFMENLKNGRKQQFIMLFLIMTISLGVYHATIARTIYQNAVNNVEYLDGTDMIIREVWKDNSMLVAQDPTIEFTYYEPDFNKYAALDCAESYTKVVNNPSAFALVSSRDKQATTIMGIHTKEFGSQTNLSSGIQDKPYYAYLNDMARLETGILVSENFHSIMGYEIGDKITYSYSKGKSSPGEIVGFVSYWPGFQPQTMIQNADGTTDIQENYLIVANYSVLREYWGITPYEVWIQLKEDADLNEIDLWAQQHDVKLKKYIVRDKDLEEVMQDPLLQGTNGVLTMEFIVTILLCAVGYLIYWIMSVKSRELMFGVLRACGMHKRELIHMLINEQVFSGLFSVLAGIGIGKLASYLFVPMVQLAYAASNQVLPMKMMVEASDMLRLYGAITVVIGVCLAVLIGLLFKLNITNTLKLGEE